MPSSSTTQAADREADPARDSTDGQQIRDYLATMLAVLVPVLAYVEVEATPAWYPTWLYVGEFTVPTGMLSPMALGIAVLWSAAGRYRLTGDVQTGDVGVAGVAIVTVLTGMYAITYLNVASGGVFFAGLPPLVLGVLLALTVLARRVPVFLDNRSR